MRAKSRFFVLLPAIVVAMLLTGCSYRYKCSTTFGSSSCTPSGGGIGGGGGNGGGGGASLAAFVYYADDNAGTINAISLDTTSNFLPISGFASPTFTSDIDGGMKIVNSKFLYLNLIIAGEVLAYSINHTDGSLTPVVGGPFVGPAGISIASDPAGKFLFVGDENGIDVWAYTINQTTGALSTVPGSPFAYTGPFFDRMTVDGKGKFLYGSGFQGSSVAAFSIDQSTGALTAVPGSPFTFNIQDVKGEASGKYLVGVSGQTGVGGTIVDDHIYVFAIDQVTGAISQVSGSPFATTSAPFGLVVSPNGNFVYTFNENTGGSLDPIEGYGINSTTGALTAVTGSPFTGLLPYPGICFFEETGTELFCHPDFDFSVLNASVTTGTMTQTITGQSVSSNFSYAVTDQ